MTKKKLVSLALVLVLAIGLMAGCGGSKNTTSGGSGEKADTILKSTVIYTVAEEEPISGGIAIKDGKILAVGTEEEMEAYTDDKTEVVDYGDQMIMPGFVDAHTHSTIAETVVGVDLTFIDDRNIATEKVKEFIEENPDTEAIIGGGWYAAVWGGEDPDKSYLDAATTDKPVVLWDYDHHCVWANSKAMEMAGVDAAKAKEFNDAKGQEYIAVDDKGEPTGYFRDLEACGLVAGIMPEFTADDLEFCINVWNMFGVTTINEMTGRMADDEYFDMIEELSKNDRLTVRHMLSCNPEETDENVEALKKRFSYNEDLLHVTAFKAWMDGAGSSHTATMLQNYVDEDNNGGAPYYTAEQVTAMVEKADKHGLATHFHACGDAAIRTTLDGYEQAAKDGVKLDTRFSIEHFDTIAKEDINRPAELGISCNITPDFMDPTAQYDTNPYLQVYDEEIIKELWNWGSLYKSGANVAFATDGYFSSYSPFVQIYRATERVMNDGKPEGGFLPEEKLELKDAIKCYTLNAAISCGMQDKVGTLEAGKYADIIVLDTNILTCTPDELFKAAVDKTYMNGKLIYEKDSAKK